MTTPSIAQARPTAKLLAFILFAILISCRKDQSDAEQIDPAQRSKIAEYLRSPRIQTVSFQNFAKEVDMATLGRLGAVMESYRGRANGTMATRATTAQHKHIR